MYVYFDGARMMNLLHVRKQDRDLKHFILLLWSKFIFKKSGKPLSSRTCKNEHLICRAKVLKVSCRVLDFTIHIVTLHFAPE